MLKIGHGASFAAVHQKMSQDWCGRLNSVGIQHNALHPFLSESNMLLWLAELWQQQVAWVPVIKDDQQSFCFLLKYALSHEESSPAGPREGKKKKE